MQKPEKKLTYTFPEVSKMFTRLDTLGRENRALSDRLQMALDEAIALRHEKESLQERLADFELYYARERTKAKTLPVERYS